jgi:hypothetical protein
LKLEVAAVAATHLPSPTVAATPGNDSFSSSFIPAFQLSIIGAGAAVGVVVIVVVVALVKRQQRQLTRTDSKVLSFSVDIITVTSLKPQAHAAHKCAATKSCIKPKQGWRGVHWASAARS